MRRSIHTAKGIVERELTETEVKELAERGDAEAQIELGWLRGPARKIPNYGEDIKKLRARIEKLEKRKPVVREVVKEVPAPAPVEAPPEKKKPWYKFW